MEIERSEYLEKHRVARLIGAPPGYVGYGGGGQVGGGSEVRFTVKDDAFEMT